MTKKGLSLAELLVAMVIFTLVTGAIYTITIMSYSSRSRELTLIDLMRARNALDRIVREVRASSSATVTTVSVSSDKIVFTIPTADGIPISKSMDIDPWRLYE